MDKLEQLLASLAATDQRIDALLANDTLSDAQEKEHATLTADRKKVVANIQREKDKQAREDERNRLTADADVARERQSRAAEPTSRRLTTEDAPTRAEPKILVKENFKDDPKGGFKSHRDFLMTVMHVGQGGATDGRLKHLWQPGREATVGSDEARGISDPAGGYLIPTAFSPDLFKIMPEADPMGGLTRQVPMNNPSLNIPARVDKDHTSSVSGGLTVTRRPETVAGTASQMTFEMINLRAHTLFGLSYATEEILTDSPISFVALLEAGFSDQFTSHLINERLNGTGVGEFLGIMNSLTSNSTGPTISVAKETGQAAATIVKENIDKMRSRCWGYGKAIWLASYDSLPQLRSLVQQVGVGGVPVAYLTVGVNGEAYMDGRPLIFTEYCKAVGTTGDLVLGNWSEYLEGMYQPLQNAESLHVRFIQHERAFKFWLRNAGMPWWRTVLTPKNSQATLSPFVILATRA